MLYVCMYACMYVCVCVYDLQQLWKVEVYELRLVVCHLQHPHYLRMYVCMYVC